MRNALRCAVAVGSIFLASVLSVEPVGAHSGGTDENGCHSGTQPYHCHVGSGSLGSARRFYKANGLDRTGRFQVRYKRHKSCASLNKLYIRGVAKKDKLSYGLGQLVSARLYNLNRHLDVDGNGVACGMLDTENARITNIGCDRTSPPLGDGTTLTAPLRCTIPAQPTNELGGGWLIEILSRTPDAALALKAEFPEASPPDPGFQFYMVKFRVTNLTGKSNIFLTSRLGTAGSSGRTYELDTDDCSNGIVRGLVPQDLRTHGMVAPGKSITGNLCWSVLATDVAGLAVYYESSRYCNCNMYNWIDRKIFVSPY